MAGVQANRDECERIFKRFDTDGDGQISLTEFTNALKELGATSQEEISQKMKEIDKNGDGFISLEELIEFLGTKPELMDLFKKL